MCLAIVVPQSSVLFAFDISGEAVKDPLPALFLHFGDVYIFGLESFDNLNAGLGRLEADGDLAVFAQNVFDKPLGNNLSVSAFKVEPKAAIAGFHAITEPSTGPQVVAAAWVVPIIN